MTTTEETRNDPGTAAEELRLLIEVGRHTERFERQYQEATQAAETAAQALADHCERFNLRKAAYIAAGGDFEAQNAHELREPAFG